MDLLLLISGAYIIYCIFSMIGLRRLNKGSDFYADLMVAAAFGFFLLTGFSNMQELTKESFGILSAIYGFIILIYGFLSYLMKAKNDLRKSK